MLRRERIDHDFNRTNVLMHHETFIFINIHRHYLVTSNVNLDKEVNKVMIIVN